MLSKPGKWHFIFHRISMVAIPRVYSVDVGGAEAMRDLLKQIYRRDRTVQLVSAL